MKLLGSAKNEITKDKNGENVPLKLLKQLSAMTINIIQEPCMHLFQINLLVNYRYFIKKIFLKSFNSEFLYIEVWFTDQNSKLLEVVDKINTALVIN